MATDNSHNTGQTIFNSSLVQKIRSIVVEKSYQKIQKNINQNRFNLFKWASRITRGTIHLIFKSVFSVIGGVLGILSLPFGKWKAVAAKNRFKNVYGVFDTIARVLEGIIVLVVDSVVRLLLCPHWWYTVCTTAKDHANEYNISYQDSLSLCVAESFLAVVEYAFRANFDDMPQLDDANKRRLSESIQTALPVNTMSISSNQYRSLIGNNEENVELQPIDDDQKSDVSTSYFGQIMRQNVASMSRTTDFHVSKLCVKCEDYPRDHACIPCGCKILCNNSDCQKLCNGKCPECDGAIQGFLKIKEY